MSNIHILFEAPRTTKAINPSNSIVIIGFCNQGPAWKPVYVDKYDRGVSIFGNCGLMKSWLSAKLVNPNCDVYIMRANGMHAVTSILTKIDLTPSADTTDRDAFYLQARNAGTAYNGVAAAVIYGDSAGVPSIMRLFNTDDTYRDYDLKKISTVNKLCEMINSDAELGLVEYETVNHTLTPISCSSLVPMSYTMILGSDDNPGTTITEDAYRMSLNDYPIGHIVVDGFYYGVDDDYVRALAEFCYERNITGIPTLGFMPVRPKADDETIADYVVELCGYEHSILSGIDDMGAYVISAVGELNIYSNHVSITTSCASAAAALCTLYNTTSSIANKKVYGSPTIKFSSDEILALRRAGINPIRESVRKGTVFDSAVTLAESTSSYSQLINTRIAQKVVESVVSILQDSIGGVDSDINDSVLDSSVNTALSNLIDAGYIRDYKYWITNTDIGEKTVMIEFVPVSDIRSVTVTVGI